MVEKMEKSANKVVGRWCRYWRNSLRVEGKRTRGANNEELFQLMDECCGTNWSRMESSNIRKWESGAQMPSRKFIMDLGKTCRIDEAEVDCVLRIAKLEPLMPSRHLFDVLETAKDIETKLAAWGVAQEEMQAVISSIDTRLHDQGVAQAHVSVAVEGISSTLTNQGVVQEDVRASTRSIDGKVDDLLEDVGEIRTEIVGRGRSLNVLDVVWSAVKKGIVPSFYILIAGYLLEVLGLDSTGIMLAYVGIGMSIVLGYGLSRWLKSNEIGEFLFVSLFITLNTPLLQTTLTKIDHFGFYTVAWWSGIAFPIAASMLVNLLLSLVALVMFDILWKWQYRDRKLGNPYMRAVWIVIPPALFVYVHLVVFSNVGAWIYFLMVLGVMSGALVVITALRDPATVLDEWTSKLYFQYGILVTVVLSALGAVALAIGYLDPNLVAVSDHNLLRSWEIDYSALGYAESEFVDRLRLGYLWMTIAGLVYMTIALGSYLLMTVYRHVSAAASDGGEG